ncbi:hypothetical protein ACP70R_008751 [Stipagrostis hirtigluma subsp. patula]
MEFATGALGTLLPKLAQLLKDEYNLPKSVKKDIDFLMRELESSCAALCKVGEVPPEQRDKQVKIWARDIRELSYDMEDIVDKFLVRIEGPDPPSKRSFIRFIKKMRRMVSKGKTRHQIAEEIKDIKECVKDIAERRYRYNIDTIYPATTTIDPRVRALYTKATDLVGIDKAREEVIKMLTEGDAMSTQQQRIVSIVGFGVSWHLLSRNPDLKKFLKDMLYELDKGVYENIHSRTLDEKQLIDLVQEFLINKRGGWKSTPKFKAHESTLLNMEKAFYMKLREKHQNEQVVAHWYFIVVDDIWEVSSWKAIRLALDDNNLGSKIIITTRKTDVAEQVSRSYKIKPLLPESSKELFYGRIFGSEDNCPRNFVEVSKNILKQCGGVPLAIITMSSLLANKLHDITEWNKVCDSIGSGNISSDDDMNNMRKILSLSYYDLPPHLKTCLLYLSVFPEDYDIQKDYLIWRWIAESFIQSHGYSDHLFELGESYFNELINRNLIQPLKDEYSANVRGCRVHDMVLDLICSMSIEENFVTISSDTEKNISPGTMLRRLSLKNNNWPTTSMSHLRSLAVSSRGVVSSMPSLSSFHVLRVLHLEGCCLKDLKFSVGNLIHLRYLGLVNTDLDELPVGIEKLQFLQALKVSGKLWLSCLPSTIFGLRQLMCIDGIECYPRQGNQLRNLASLQVLRALHLGEESTSAVEELGHLTQLRKLEIWIHQQMGQSLCDALIKSLCNLRELQGLNITQLKPSNFEWENWKPSPNLRTLSLLVNSSLPKWITPASVPLISELALYNVSKVGPEDIQVLGMLPALCRLDLCAESGNVERPWPRSVVSADTFPCATRCQFFQVVTVPSMFPRGAMPRVIELKLCLRSRDFFSDGIFDFDDLSIGHLPSLRSVVVDIHTSPSSEEVTKIKEALRHAARVHPNNPFIDIRYDDD